MIGRVRVFVILFTVSLFSFTMFDYLQIGWFVQWNGGPAPVTQQAFIFLVIFLIRATIAEYVTSKLLGVKYRIKNYLLSLLVYGLPLITMIIGFNISPIPAYIPASLERTFIGAVISWLELTVILDFSRLTLLYLVKPRIIT